MRTQIHNYEREYEEELAGVFRDRKEWDNGTEEERKWVDAKIRSLIEQGKANAKPEDYQPLKCPVCTVYPNIASLGDLSQHLSKAHQVETEGIAASGGAVVFFTNRGVMPIRQ